MALKEYKPYTPARRWMTGYRFEELTKKKPQKSLLVPLKKTGGRNSFGRVTARRKSGGHKRMLRIVDFKFNKLDVPATVLGIEYDPNRTARIALIQYQDGEKRYILWPEGLKKGDTVVTGSNAELTPGNRLPLRNIPAGIPIHNLELIKSQGAQAIRSAGSQAIIMAKEEKYAHVKMPSGEVRLVDLDCMASIGQVGNVEHKDISIGKAGRNRWKGRKPCSRGVAKNPIAHPMGGGEGKSSGGRHPCSPWGQLAKGLKTRKRKKSSDKFIMTRRK